MERDQLCLGSALGIAQIGAVVIYSLRVSIAAWEAAVHSKGMSLHNMSVRGLVISLNLGMKRWQKPARPRKLRMSLTELGVGQAKIAATFSGSMATPFWCDDVP
jgi:hypothetical protein